MKYKDVNNFIDGKFVANESTRLDVICPLNGEKISTVPLSTARDLDQAVEAAKKAFPKWAGLTSK
jgi:malonate-semialdehyde dehydrogenase (acetylating)/methylmalonate-semialdehyde dehydrogenase